MQLIKKNKKYCSHPFQGATVCEYPTNNPDINAAYIKNKGRYPDQGKVVNHQCQELIYVIEGRGQLICEGKTTEFETGDMLIIKPEEKYYWQGNFTACVSNNPKWTVEQHEVLK